MNPSVSFCDLRDIGFERRELFPDLFGDRSRLVGVGYNRGRDQQNQFRSIAIITLRSEKAANNRNFR